jgi:serine/threonine-protein phosphatase 2A activator
MAVGYNLHRQILSGADLKDFLGSPAFLRIESFLLQLNESVKGKEREDAEYCGCSALIRWLLALLAASEELIDSFPPQNRNADVNRFGNVAFRDWLFEMQETLLPKHFAGLDSASRSELEGYFVNSLGSSQRIDYGTGHELHFLVFLMGLEAEEADYPDLVLKVFSGYLRLMRKLQRVYWLEPAGSHGVWGLDDYHFLPFLLGSAQLCGHENIRPRAVHSTEIVHYLAPKYIYFDFILHILEIKVDGNDADQLTGTSALRWLSPILDDISIVKTWEKVNSGLIKMWRVEVMSKLPILQHLLFDESQRILPFTRNQNNSIAQPEAVHYSHSLRGDCCGNPLPSIYAAMKDKNQQPGLPFD